MRDCKDALTQEAVRDIPAVTTTRTRTSAIAIVTTIITNSHGFTHSLTKLPLRTDPEKR